MGIDFLLAAGGALVAIYGIARDVRPATKRVLIGVVLIIASATAVKAYVDDGDKDLMRAALIGTLQPPPASVTGMYKLIKGEALEKGYRDLDYMSLDEGMVLYLSTPSGHPPEAVVLDRLDIASLYAKLLMEEGSSGLEKVLWHYIPALSYFRAEEALITKFLAQDFGEHDLDDGGFNEDLYGRLCILARTSVHQVLRRSGESCDYDDKIGITISFDIAGQTQTLKVPPGDITNALTTEKVSARVLFASLDQHLRSEVEKLIPKSH